MAAGSAAGSYVRSYPAKSCKSRRLVLASILQTLAPPRCCKAPRAALPLQMAARTRGDQKMPPASRAAAKSHS